MKPISLIQTIVAIALIIVILLQQKGAGLGGVFGGSSNVFSTKRGIEKTLFNLTIILAVTFIGLSLINVIW